MVLGLEGISGMLLAQTLGQGSCGRVVWSLVSSAGTGDSSAGAERYPGLVIVCSQSL